MTRVGILPSHAHLLPEQLDPSQLTSDSSFPLTHTWRQQAMAHALESLPPAREACPHLGLAQASGKSLSGSHPNK